MEASWGAICCVPFLGSATLTSGLSLRIIVPQVYLRKFRVWVHLGAVDCSELFWVTVTLTSDFILLKLCALTSDFDVLKLCAKHITYIDAI